MYCEYIRDLVNNYTNSYQLVQALKGLRADGQTTIRTRYASHPIGKVMHEIITMSKMGYTYSEIVDELVS